MFSSRDTALATGCLRSQRHWVSASRIEDFLGRWLIGGAGSAEYTRTSRQIIHKLQIAACKAITCGEGGEYNEDEAIAEMKNFVDERGGSGTLVRRRHSVMKLVEGVRQLGIKWPTLGPFPSGEPSDLVEPVAEAVAEPSPKVLHQHQQEDWPSQTAPQWALPCEAISLYQGHLQ